MVSLLARNGSGAWFGLVPLLMAGLLWVGVLSEVAAPLGRVVGLSAAAAGPTAVVRVTKLPDATCICAAR